MPGILDRQLVQAQKLAPQQIRALAVLQMNTQELLAYMEREVQENPLLEREEGYTEEQAYVELLRMEAMNGRRLQGQRGADEELRIEPGAVDSRMDSLSAFLKDQLARQHMPKRLNVLCNYLADLVDENGYLEQEDIDELCSLKIPAEFVENALQKLQGLEPAGVGARSLSECLLLQLGRIGTVPQLLETLIKDHLEELGKKQYGLIAKSTGRAVAEIREAVKKISKLEPYPGRLFWSSEPEIPVRPDMFIIEEDGMLRAVLNERFIPKIKIGDYYLRLLKESNDPETVKYLRDKITQAYWVLQTLQQRRDTLRRCAEAILSAQYRFFSDMTAELVPMRMNRLAEQLEMHPSTITRALQGKYLECRRGVYPLKYFFSPAVANGEYSRQAIKYKISSMISVEDKQHPLSDEQICLVLLEDGVQIARRTVAKYRCELGVESASARKREPQKLAHSF